jgi:hypothetical protein
MRVESVLRIPPSDRAANPAAPRQLMSRLGPRMSGLEPEQARVLKRHEADRPIVRRLFLNDDKHVFGWEEPVSALVHRLAGGPLLITAPISILRFGPVESR